MTQQTPEDAPARPGSAADAGPDALIVDRFHLAYRDEGLLPADGRLHAVTEGRSIGSLPVSPAAGGAWRIPFGPEAALREGQAVQLLLEEGAHAKLLASGHVATRVAGAIDRCSESLVRGWAANLRCPELPLRLDILVHGELLGTAVAERRRLDLERLGRGLGSTGFLFKFLPPLRLTHGRGTSVGVRIPGTDIELAHSPWVLCHGFERLPPPVSSATTRHAAGRPA